MKRALSGFSSVASVDREGLLHVDRRTGEGRDASAPELARDASTDRRTRERTFDDVRRGRAAVLIDGVLVTTAAARASGLRAPLTVARAERRRGRAAI